MSGERVRVPTREPDGSSQSLETVRKGTERALIVDALVATHGRRADAARRLGISRKTLWKKLKQLAIDSTHVTER
jgi:two-component system nitrogen regulation response regulator GlnG